jgi:hypothetical protein
MEVRGAEPNVEAHTPPSKWHRVRQWWARHWLNRTNSGQWAEKSDGWGRTRGKAKTGGLTRAQLRDEIRLGQHAQQLREEATTLGGREERAAFYGHGEHMGRGEERKLQIARYERELAAHEAAERARYEDELAGSPYPGLMP